MKYLNDEQKKKFDEDGFLLVKNLFRKEEISPLRESITKFSQKKSNDWKKGEEMAYYETNTEDNDERILCRIEKYVDYHPEFKAIAYSKKILDCMEDIIGESCILFKDKINFKRPGAGGFRPHQDVQARWDDFAKYTLSIMISTDVSTPENGCLQVARGHHKRGLIGKYDRPLEGKDLDGMIFEKVPTEIGDVLFFDHYTPHKSEPNRSSEPRSNIYLTYNGISKGDRRMEYLSRKRKELPPDNERDGKIEFENSPIHEALYKNT
jgi:ectoine hydroxylase-related dioxygenase (phytanoyl-CoA dioxygenase family)